ncbi:MAG: glycosyltransferase [Betaproteobacteria bacterium]|nr:glycosyltransferase [Betaproteobacteria bacterium]
MRILHLIETLDFGGAEKIVISLANATIAHHEVSICCMKHKGALEREVDPRVPVLSLGKGEGNDATMPWKIARLLREGDFDVLHTHNWGVFLEGGLAAMLAGTGARVHTVHGPYREYPAGLKSRLKLGLRHFLERLVARRFHRIAGVSDAISRYIVEDIGVRGGNVCTVHNGIPVTAGAPPSREGAGPVVFLSTGRLAEIKNHALMLRAFRRALDAGAPARLRIAGDGPLREAIEAQRRELGLEAQVELLGFRDDIPQLLAGSHAFLLTSRYEGISVALLEAMRACLPIIATRVGGVPETVLDGETGLLFAADDEAGIAGAITELAVDGSRREALGNRGRALLREEFSLERMTGRYLDLYTACTP